MKQEDTGFGFLAGGGEMGSFVRAMDWSKTPVGAPQTWPQSLRTILAVLLNSRFPMFLWWGPELTCFYNDAYRPSLGANGKHPSILGMDAKKAWPEIWETIWPLINQVLNGEGATWSEDQLIPIYRNGRMEDVYWTFSYSPVNNDSGKIAGVLVTCVETTEKVNTLLKLSQSEQQLEQSEAKLRMIILQAPVAIAIFRGPEYTTEIVNEKALALVGRSKNDVLNKPILEAVPELKLQGLGNLLDEVYLTGNKFSAVELPIQLVRQDNLETAYLNFSFEPMYNNQGLVDGIMAVGVDVTAQVLAHKKVERNEEKLSIVIAASELGTWEIDLQTNTVEYSERFLEILGYKEFKEVSLDDLRSQVHPDDESLRTLAYEKAFETGVFYFKGRIIWPDQTIHWIENKGTIFYDDRQRPSRMMGTIRDITEEQQQQQVLLKSEQKFRLLADSMPQFVWTGDAQGKLNYFNRAVFDYSGLTLEQIANDGWIRMVHDDDKEKNIKAWNDAVTTGTGFLFEHRFRRKDGTFRWQLSRAVPQYDNDGKIQMWVGTSTDIQDQKMFAHKLEMLVQERTKELSQTNESLKKSEERYHLMVEEVLDYSIIYLNRDGIIENWNTGAEKIKGYMAGEIIGKNFSVFYTEAERNNNVPAGLLSKAAQEGRVVHEGWRVKKDGSLFWASVVITAIHDESKKVIGFSKVTHDLTEKKAADDLLRKNSEELQRSNEDLSKMNKELEAFAYISSHDLQEPLRKIQTFASRILDKDFESLSETGRGYFDRIQDSAERMQTLIDDLLAYSRTRNGERKYERTDLDKIVEEVKADFEDELRQSNARVEIVDMSFTANIIPFQFRQLLSNLISNSLKFTSPERTPYIRITGTLGKGKQFNNGSLSEETTYFHVQVADNGIGFDQQYSDRIFGLFQRLHGKSAYAGTGIGLAIVKKIVENHHGVIAVTGVPDKGATFDIYLPQ